MDRRLQIKQWLKEILETNLSGMPYRAFIFGSQANAGVLKRADIDIGIIANSQISNEALSKINNAIEDLPILFKVDVVDFNQVTEVFKSVALRNTEQL